MLSYKISTINKVNNQLKNIKTLMNTIIEDIKKNKIKLQNLSSDIINNNFKNNKGILNNSSPNKDVINKYNEKIKNLEKEIENKDNIIKELKSKNVELKNVIEILKQNHEKIITEMEKKIDALKSRISFGKIDLGKSISVVFIYDCCYEIGPIKCKSKQMFWEIENLVYEKFPQYKKNNYYFITAGNVVGTYKTLEENGIRDGSKILMSRKGLD